MHNMKTFSIGDAIKLGWEKTWAHFLFILGVTAISFIVSVITGRVQEILGEGAPLIGSIMFVIGFVISSILTIGYYKIFLNLYDGKHADFKDLYKHYKLFWNYLVTSIIYGLAVIIGLVLLIVPGIYLAIKYMFALLIVIDEETTTPTEALAKSADITLGVKWSLLGFIILIILINLLGVLLLGVGLLVAIPLSTFATIYIYRRLAHETAGEVVVSEAPSNEEKSAE